MHRVILIDDEVWALKGIKNIIDWKAYGFDVIKTYTDPYEALDGIKELKPDVVFTDIRMEGLTGLDIIKETRKTNDNCEFVFVSAYSDFEAAREALIFGVFHYLLKPLDKSKVKKLVIRLKEHLKKQRNSTDIEYIELNELGNKNWSEINAELDSNSYCYAVVYDNATWDIDLGIEHIVLKTIVINRGIRLYLIASKEKLDAYLTKVMQKKLIDDKDFGYSRRRKSFDECETMYYEAELSMLTQSSLSSNDNVVNVQNYIIKNYKNKISLKEISQALFLTDTYLCEIFKKYTGQTISSYISELRMKKAAKLIQRSDFSLKEVAQNVGYSNYAYFGKVFKQHYSISPEKYRTQTGKVLDA